jgi:enolase
VRAIASVRAREVLDSRGHPTVEAEVTLEGGAVGRAVVPSGASTGSREAVELRDGDPGRYGGRGVLAAVRHVVEVLGPAVRGLDAADQAAVDRRLVEADGTPNKARLGANAVLAVSLATAHAAARAQGVPLYRYLGGALARTLPVPLLNVLNGGRHADNPLELQEFMLVPAGLPTFREALRAAAETYHALRVLLRERGLGTGIGDEGGFAPQVTDGREALALLVDAIERAGYRPGEDVWLAVDAAATELLGPDGRYHLEGRALGAEELVERFARWAEEFPLVSLEDGLGEEDWAGWRELTRRLGGRLQLVGDDLFVTQAPRLARGVAERVANAILIKPNQVGTLTETWEAVETAHRAGYRAILSHRSGETEDVTIAHLAVATGCGQIKTGAPARGERVGKYNELLRIEEELGASARYAGRDALRPLVVPRPAGGGEEGPR